MTSAEWKSLYDNAVNSIKEKTERKNQVEKVRNRLMSNYDSTIRGINKYTSRVINNADECIYIDGKSVDVSGIGEVKIMESSLDSPISSLDNELATIISEINTLADNRDRYWNNYLAEKAAEEEAARRAAEEARRQQLEKIAATVGISK